jgi:hypothetical protein
LIFVNFHAGCFEVGSYLELEYWPLGSKRLSIARLDI